jgi:hypothetical protein
MIIIFLPKQEQNGAVKINLVISADSLFITFDLGKSLKVVSWFHLKSFLKKNVSFEIKPSFTRFFCTYLPTIN